MPDPGRPPPRTRESASGTQSSTAAGHYMRHEKNDGRRFRSVGRDYGRTCFERLPSPKSRERPTVNGRVSWLPKIRPKSDPQLAVRVPVAVPNISMTGCDSMRTVPRWVSRQKIALDVGAKGWVVSAVMTKGSGLGGGAVIVQCP